MAACVNSHASLVIFDPDNFAVGTLLDDAVIGVSLSVDGLPGSGVQAIDGFSLFNNRNLTTTGSLVFGQSPPHSVDVPYGRDELNGLFRADFDTPTDFVSIDVIFDDDDFGRLLAFDASTNLLATVSVAGDGRGPVPFQTTSITRAGADIAYVLVGGDLGEALALDNFQFNQFTVTELGTVPLLAFGVVGVGWARYLKRRAPLVLPEKARERRGQGDRRDARHSR
jgi:hypothetical protein